MLSANGHPQMTSADLKELIARRGWTKRHLAEECNVSEAAVHKWFRNGVTGGTAAVLLRTWLEESRGNLKRFQVVG